MTEIFIHKNIKALRLHGQRSQHMLAAEIGMSRPRIAAHEEKRNRPSYEDLKKYSQFFGISVDDLVFKQL